MNLEASADLIDLRRRARRAYELGRLRAASFGALPIASAGALLGAWLVGPHAIWWAPLTFSVWLVLGWRGGALLRGARYGLLAGGLTLLLPLSVLRPCCSWDASGLTHCTMPELCVALGAAVGLPLAGLVLLRREPKRVEAAFGLWLGVVSVATFKCSALFVGEALGLLGGLAVGVLAASTLSSITTRTTHA